MGLEPILIGLKDRCTAIVLLTHLADSNANALLRMEDLLRLELSTGRV
jgi:hypothetical protein